MTIVRLERVSKSFDSRNQALNEIDLVLRPGEIVALTGPSGSGKTTLLRLIAGLETPTSGTVWIDDRAGSSLAPQQRNVSMVFQHSVLMPHLTARENLAFSRRFHRRRLEDRVSEDRDWNQRLSTLAELLEINELLDRMPWQLSGGERQRVAFGRAAIRQSDVLLLDEPFSNLDVVLRRRLQLRLREDFHQRAVPVLLATHDGSDVETLADRVVILRQGRMEQVGEMVELQERPRTAFVKEWLSALTGRGGRTIVDKE